LIKRIWPAAHFFNQKSGACKGRKERLEGGEGREAARIKEGYLLMFVGVYMFATCVSWACLYTRTCVRVCVCMCVCICYQVRWRPTVSMTPACVSEKRGRGRAREGEKEDGIEPLRMWGRRGGVRVERDLEGGQEGVRVGMRRGRKNKRRQEGREKHHGRKRGRHRRWKGGGKRQRARCHCHYSQPEIEFHRQCSLITRGFQQGRFTPSCYEPVVSISEPT